MRGTCWEPGDTALVSALLEILPEWRGLLIALKCSDVVPAVKGWECWGAAVGVQPFPGHRDSEEPVIDHLQGRRALLCLGDGP